MKSELPVRDAATVVVLRRDPDSGPRVLMGQRGAAAAFMPNKFVFPGGAVDAADSTVPLLDGFAEACARRLALPAIADAPQISPQAIAAAAIRELWEETGLALGRAGEWTAPADGWSAFSARGLGPTAAPLRYIFRAITPAGRPRRFDARFLLLDADALDGDPDDFSDASDELSHLQWIPLAEARRFDLPFITEVVLAEVAQLVRTGGAPASVPFFDNSGPVPAFRRIV